MSLDVFLHLDEPIEIPIGTGVYVRDDGGTRQLSWEECEERWPGEIEKPEGTYEDTLVHCDNITHNLGRMASEAGIYDALWCPDEIGITHARQLPPILRPGLALLVNQPDHFKAFNPKNGWGDYEGLAEFVRAYINACERHPDARVSVSR